MSAPEAPGRALEARDYLAAVERQLDDLPEEDRAALLEDLEAHLDALVEEGDDRPIVIRLGSPAGYAADLRAAAGLPARGTARTTIRLARLRQQLARAEAHPLGAEVRRLLVELRPAWWVLRGYLAVFVLCSLGYGQRDGLLPAPLGSRLLGLILVLAAVAGSVRLGRRQLPERARRLVVAGGALLALVAFAQGAESHTWTGWYPEYYVPAAESGQPTSDYPLVSPYGPVTDVLPYAADGTPLTGVLLYDQDGRPLHVGEQQWWADGCARERRQPLAADGVPVPNVFPQTYVVDASGADGYGNAGPCDATVARPDVPVPTFPAAATGDPTAASATSTPAATSAPASVSAAPTEPSPTPGG